MSLDSPDSAQTCHATPCGAAGQRITFRADVIQVEEARACGQCLSASTCVQEWYLIFLLRLSPKVAKNRFLLQNYGNPGAHGSDYASKNSCQKSMHSKGLVEFLHMRQGACGAAHPLNGGAIPKDIEKCRFRPIVAAPIHPG
jgi:hypothetical protein